MFHDDTEHNTVLDSYFGTDLACERKRADTDIPGVECKRETSGGYVWERIRISTDEGAESIGRPIGNYDTLNADETNSADDEGIDAAAKEVANELSFMLEISRAKKDRLLIVGLGNGRLTPDSIGPRTAELINPTMHIKGEDAALFSKLGCSQIAVITPNVTSKSGIEASDIVSSVSARLNPHAVIVIDSLASRSPSRLGKTIQFSNTGIFPGSGIGNKRGKICESLLGVPVISIGVPTVINSRHFSINESEDIKKGTFPALFVSPHNIDEIVDLYAKIISKGINLAFGIP